MRRPIVAIAVAALILAAATAGGSVLQACGGTTATTTQAAASGAPGGGQAPDMSSMFTTALEVDELLVAIKFPIPEKAGYAKMRNPASRYVMAGAFVSKGPMGLRVAINGAGPCVFRQAEMEAALAGSWSPDAVAGVKQDPDGMNGDIHGSAEYRAHLVTVMAKRAVAAAG